MVIESAICEILDGTRILLIKATRGPNKGKWSAVGGKMEKGETPLQGATRELFEESSLTGRNLFYHGKISYYMDNKPDLIYLVNVFSTTDFSGTIKSTEEGELNWFEKSATPYDLMWDDDRYWMPLMFQGKKFECDFYYDEKNQKVIKHSIELKD